MKNTALLITLLIVCLPLVCQKVIENRVVPLAGDEGTVIRIEEQLRIVDNPPQFVFKRPGRFEIAADGSIFAYDSNALYRFSATGKFLGNLYRKGQGPGELGYLLRYFISGEAVILFDHYTGKVVKCDFSGKLQTEFRIPGRGMKLLFGVIGTTYYYTVLSPEQMEMRPKTGSGIITQKYRILTWNEGDEQPEPSDILLPATSYVAASGSGSMMIGQSRIIHANLVGDTHFCSFTREYLIHRIDFTRGRFDGRFNRPYKHLKFTRPKPKTERKLSPAMAKIPRREYYDDVVQLINRGDCLWVVTSTLEAGKGVLVDVYDYEGKYQKKLYLPLVGADKPPFPSFTVSGDRLLVREMDADDNPNLVVYRIIHLSPVDGTGITGR